MGASKLPATLQWHVARWHVLYLIEYKEELLAGVQWEAKHRGNSSLEGWPFN
jgi:hypothetical protein